MQSITQYIRHIFNLIKTDPFYKNIVNIPLTNQRFINNNFLDILIHFQLKFNY